MSFDMQEVKESLIESVPQLEEMLDSLIQEASHHMSEASRQTWLQNAQGIAYLGKGQQIVISYLEACRKLCRRSKMKFWMMFWKR